MVDIMIIGSINMDLVTKVDHIPKVGETILGTSFSQIPGGKGANQAVAVARLGASIKMIGKVGHDSSGEILLNKLREDNVGTQYIASDSNEPTGTALITVEESGDNSIVVVPGANFDINVEDVNVAIDEIVKSKIIISQLEVPIEIVSHTFKKAKEAGVFTILNPAPAAKLNRDLISCIDLLTPNETELELLSGITINNEEDIIEASNVLITQGIKQIIVTLGAKGCMYIDKDKHKRYSSNKVNPVDTTAAGDSFTAAIAVAMSEGKTIDEMIEFASKVGALTVTKFGAQSSLPYREEVDKYEGGK